jgi:hypothetical protein
MSFEIISDQQKITPEYSINPHDVFGIAREDEEESLLDMLTVERTCFFFTSGSSRALGHHFA